MGIGDWGLGIGDWAQSPIPNPNPQSPIPNPHVVFYNKNFIINIYLIIILFLLIFYYYIYKLPYLEGVLLLLNINIYYLLKN